MTDIRRDHLEHQIINLRSQKRELEKTAPFKKAAVASRMFETLLEIVTDLSVRLDMAERRITELQEKTE